MAACEEEMLLLWRKMPAAPQMLVTSPLTYGDI